MNHAAMMDPSEKGQVERAMNQSTTRTGDDADQVSKTHGVWIILILFISSEKCLKEIGLLASGADGRACEWRYSTALALR